MRVSAGFSRLLRLEGVWVRRVQFNTDRVVVWVALRRRRLRCPLCGYSTPYRHNRQQAESTWRHLDLGVWRLELRDELVERSHGRIRADAAHGKLVALRYQGSERTTRRWVAAAKRRWRREHGRVTRPLLPEPGLSPTAQTATGSRRRPPGRGSNP
jgi:hypothetical protein